MKTATLLLTDDVTVECPYCGERVDGFINDPRGKTVDCDYCAKEFQIHEDADLELDY